MAKEKSCEWIQTDFDSNTWDSDCGNSFDLNDGSPSDNGMKFCPYCGRPLTEVKYQDSK